jgi:hypothetical protein
MTNAARVLAEVSISATTMEISMEVSQKTNITTII